MSRVKEQLENIEWDTHEQPQEEQKSEFTAGADPQLYGLQITEAKQLLGGIDVISAELQVLKDAYVDVIELEITTENLPVFKDLRKNFTKNRTSREKLRVAKKSYFLNGGRFVDAVFKNIDAECDLMESKLLEAEKFFENQEKQRKIELNNKRIEIIRPYVDDVTGLDFDVMTDEDFDDYVLGKKTRFENEAKEREAEALRIENERLAEIERQRLIEVENAKLKVEAELKEKALEKERAESLAKQKAIQDEANRIAKIEADKQAKIQAEKDAEIKKEREAREKLEADAKKAREEKEKAEALAIAEADKLAKAPVKKQLSVWVNSFELPATEVDNETSKEIKEKFEAFKKWSLTQVNNL